VAVGGGDGTDLTVGGGVACEMTAPPGCPTTMVGPGEVDARSTDGLETITAMAIAPTAKAATASRGHTRWRVRRALAGRAPASSPASAREGG